MPKKRLLIIADSLALARNKPQITKYEATWPVRLKHQYEVHQISIGGATLPELQRQIHYHSSFDPDFVIIQAGIVDAAPRAFTKTELLILDSNFPSRKLVKPVLMKAKRLIRRLRNKSNTSPRLFRELVKKIKSAFNVEICWIGITPVFDDYEAYVNGMRKKVALYNQLIEEELEDNYISLDQMEENGLMSDFHHLTEAGHDFVFRSVNDLLAKKLQTDE